VLGPLTNYNSELLTTATGGTATVILSANVVALADIDDAGGTVSLNLYVAAQWFDFRLRFLNLRPDRWTSFCLQKII